MPLVTLYWCGVTSEIDHIVIEITCAGWIWLPDLGSNQGHTD